MESRVKNSVGNYVIDTKKYLEILGIKKTKQDHTITTPTIDNTENEEEISNNTGIYP